MVMVNKHRRGVMPNNQRHRFVVANGNAKTSDMRIPMTIANCVHVPRVPLRVGGAISPKYTGTTTEESPEAHPIINLAGIKK